MQGYTHLMAGLAAGITLTTGQPEYIIASAVGSLLPDLDSPHTLLGSKVPLISILGGGHRGWMHSIFGTAVFSLPVYMYNPKLGQAVAIGCLTHLILDMINPAGIKLFWPFGRRYHIIGIPSSSIIGNAIISGLMLLMLLNVW